MSGRPTGPIQAIEHGSQQSPRHNNIAAHRITDVLDNMQTTMCAECNIRKQIVMLSTTMSYKQTMVCEKRATAEVYSNVCEAGDR